MTRQNLFDIMRQKKDLNYKEQLEYAQNILLKYDDYSEMQINEIKHKFSHFRSQFKQKWLAAHKKEVIFVKNNEVWLQGKLLLPRAKMRQGRPLKKFEESSERSRRRKTEMLRTTTDSIKLVYATQMQLRAEGNPEASDLLKDITSSPSRANEYKDAYSKRMSKDQTPPLSPLQALAMFVEAGLTRKQYNVIRNTNPKFFPCYSILQRAKNACYPDKDSFLVTATSAEINLQALLNHTVTRLLTHLDVVLETLNEADSNSLMMIYKWGCDGSQQSQYKQNFANDYDSDANIFQSSLVPLQLTCGLFEKRVVWQNPTPSSPRYCRPIRIRFVKENADITNEEIQYIQNSANQLEESTIVLAQRLYTVKHTLLLTMVDAKVCNAATQTTSTMKCYICGATSKTFNELSQITSVNEESLQFGLSILHARIRLFEGLLHLAYKSPVKKWQVREERDKLTVKERKVDIQKQMKDKMGLIVDIPKPGFGNTNDGNTSRRFFANPVLAAEITGLDYNFIYRIKVILETISSGHRIHIEKFAEYTTNTAKLYVQLYGWHPMTPTLHKILVHGPIIVQHALLPIGQLSEEAAEARNKNFREYRQRYSRKCSREACNLDVINRLLLTSDPIITGLRPLPRKKTKSFLKETIDMLLPPEQKYSFPDIVERNISSNDEDGSSDEEKIDTNEEITSDEELTSLSE